MLGVWPADADVDAWKPATSPGCTVKYLARGDAVRDELPTRSFNVGDDQERALCRAGRGRVRFTPSWTELPEPGGVNWTRRNFLLEGRSASSRHPSLEWNRSLSNWNRTSKQTHASHTRSSDPEGKKDEDNSCKQKENDCYLPPDLQFRADPVDDRRHRDGDDSGSEQQHHDYSTDPGEQ